MLEGGLDWAIELYKPLPLSHFVAGVRTGRVYILETAHQRIDSSAASRLRRVMLQPGAEGRVQRGVPRPRDQSRPFDQSSFRTEGDFSHETWLPLTV
jgi:hypothetical protein